jgi:hypothetical protein
MEANIERDIYDLRRCLNRMVAGDISLTDEKVLRLSIKLDKLLNIFHRSKARKKDNLSKY